MDPPFKEEPVWQPIGEDLTHVETRSESPGSGGGERRHSSSASNSTFTTGDGTDGGGTRGRRTRPSVTSASSQLATVRERNSIAGTISEKRPSLGSTVDLGSIETVISSKKVG